MHFGFTGILESLYAICGNYGIAIILLTLGLKLLLYPLANRAHKSAVKLKKLKGIILGIRFKYGRQKKEMNRLILELYKEHGINPLAGVIPMVIQIVVFCALYKVLLTSSLLHGMPFVGYLHDLSMKDPSTIINLFGYSIGFLPIVMGITMMIQQHMMPSMGGKLMQRLFMLVPVLFTVVLAHFPAALVLYWTTNNILTIGQQYLIQRKDSHA